MRNLLLASVLAMSNLSVAQAEAEYVEDELTCENANYKVTVTSTLEESDYPIRATLRLQEVGAEAYTGDVYMINPETGEAICAKSNCPVYSYNEATKVEEFKYTDNTFFKYKVDWEAQSVTLFQGTYLAGGSTIAKDVTIEGCTYAYGE